ncbi:MAG: hypothetical protein E7254_11295 [Lachnospiraceae bacterium]|nr:hypothetical protein [Lachnospiraceae bacterium]
MRKKLMKGMALVTALFMAVGIMPEYNAPKDYAQVQAAATLSITSPTDGKLLAAGYNDFTWGSVSNTKEYKVYVDGSSVGTTTSTTYRYYTTSVAMHKLKVEAVLNNGSKVDSPEITFGITKKGLAVNDVMGRHIDPVELKAGWYYDWSTNPHSFKGYDQIEFVPMIWGVGNDGAIPDVIQKNYKYLLAYNEPDMSRDYGGSDTSVEVVLQHWPNFNVSNRNYILGSPAPALCPAWGNGVWFRNFWDGLTQAQKDAIDFIPLHCYYGGGYSGVNAARSLVNDVVKGTYEMCHKPIWITEFAPSERGYGDAEARRKAKEYLEEAFKLLDELPYVERYSWFSFDATDGYNGAAALWTNSTGELTELGRTFIECGNPEGYVPPEPEKEHYTYTETTRNKLLPDSSTVNSKSYSDLTKNASISATSSINDNSGPDKAIDEKIDSRWESVQGVDPQAVVLDFKETKSIKKVDIVWETASAKNYTVEVSDDGVNYTKVADIRGGSATQNRYDSIVFDSDIEVVGRYLKIYGSERSTTYGYSIYDIAIYGEKYNKIPNEIYGLQYSTASDGFRVIANVESTINGKQVVEYGNVIGVKGASYTANAMVVGSKNEDVRSFKSTSAGLSSVNYSKSGTAKSYIMTFIDNGKTVEALTAQYAIRSYAKLSDGTYVYSDIVEFTIYGIADKLYKEKSMPTLAQHNFLYNNVLKIVNKNYSVVSY